MINDNKKLKILVKNLWNETIKYIEQRPKSKTSSNEDFRLEINNRIEALNRNGITKLDNKYHNSEGYGFSISYSWNSKRLCMFPSITNSGMYLDIIELNSFDLFVIRYFELLPKWISQISKEEKLKSLAQKSIELCVEQVMKDLSCEYCLKKETKKSVLKIKMKGRIALEIPLYHRNFQLTLPYIPSIIEQYSNLQNTKIPITINNYSKYEVWKKREV